MSELNPKVDAFLRRAKKWPEELAALRKIVLKAGLTEELKWRQPCYTFEESNVVILGEFKDFCSLSFFQGALLKDHKKLLVQPGKHTQAGRLIPFTSVQEIRKLQPVLAAYLEEAIELQKAGLKVQFKKTPEPVPEELQAKFEESPEFGAAFHALTPGRQRAYILYFSAPKQSATRTSRIQKYAEQILKGIGFHDEYQAARKSKTVSKRPPRRKRQRGRNSEM